MRDLLSKLTWVDYIALVALLRGLYVGYKTGFFPEVLRIVSYFATLFVTLQFHGWIAEQLTLRTMLNEATARAASFATLLVVVHVLLWVLRLVLVKILKLDGGGGGQKILGATLGAARLLVLLSFFFMFIDSTPLKELKNDVHSRSLTGPYIVLAAPLLYDFVSTAPAVDMGLAPMGS